MYEICTKIIPTEFNNLWTKQSVVPYGNRTATLCSEGRGEVDVA